MRLAWTGWFLVVAGCALFPGTELGGPVALYYLPLWGLFVLAGVGARRLRRLTVAAD